MFLFAGISLSQTDSSILLDWFRGHRLRRKSKKVSGLLVVMWLVITMMVNSWISCSALQADLTDHVIISSSWQGIFPACYIHLKEATVEGSGFVLHFYSRKAFFRRHFITLFHPHWLIRCHSWGLFFWFLRENQHFKLRLGTSWCCLGRMMALFHNDFTAHMINPNSQKTMI